MAAKNQRRYSHDFESRLPSLSRYTDSANNQFHTPIPIRLNHPGHEWHRFVQSLDWENYDPLPTLVVSANPVVRAKFPFIDVHSHHCRARTPTTNGQPVFREAPGSRPIREGLLQNRRIPYILPRIGILG